MEVTELPILIVDDDPGLRSMLETVLLEEGYQVETARNGREALDRLNQFVPALILLDLMMPVMDGWQFLLEMQKLPQAATLPIIVLSANSRQSEAARQPGVKAFLSKPFDLGKLLGYVQQFRN